MNVQLSRKLQEAEQKTRDFASGKILRELSGIKLSLIPWEFTREASIFLERIQIHEIPCKKCGEMIKRVYWIKDGVCYNCKKKRPNKVQMLDVRKSDPFLDDGKVCLLPRK